MLELKEISLEEMAVVDGGVSLDNGSDEKSNNGKIFNKAEGKTYKGTDGKYYQY